MIDIIRSFFNSDDFMPHGHCFLWQPGIFWMHLLSDASITAAYFAIPFALIYFIRKRSDMPFEMVFLWFGAFILLCSATHLVSIWVLWNPDYAFQGIIKALTAIVSVVTFFITVKLIPRALAIPDTRQLQDVNAELLTANKRLEILYNQLQRSGQAHLRAVIDHVLDGLISINERGIIESFNPACVRIFGYEAEEVIGQNVKMLMPDPYHSEHDGYLHNYQRTGNAKIIGTAGREVRAKRKDGTIFPIDLSISAFMLEDGQHFSGIIRDITARKQAEEALRLSDERYTLAVSGASVGIWDWKIPEDEYYWSPQFLRMIGAENTDFKPHYDTFSTLLHPDDKERALGAIAAHLGTRNNPTPYDVEYRLRHTDGHYVWIYARGQATWDAEGKPLRMSGSAVDISTKKETEQQIQEMVTRLTESNTQLESFAYVCSHDLQEPLRMISNYTQRLEKHLSESIDDKGRHYMQYITSGALRARQLIADVLSLARIGNDGDELESVDCNKALEMAMNALEERIKETGATIESETLPVVPGHRIYLAQLLQNLIGNALKFRSEKPPSIRIRARHCGTHWEFSVEDNGIGIDKEYQQKIFNVFQRLHAREQYPGTGIGLAIVRRIVELHGGRIWVESRVGHGTTFLFTIPVSIAAKAA